MKDLNKIRNNKQQAIFLAKKQLPELVCDIVNLEGINYTVPEIMTLLDGVTVGGRRQEDELVASNQIKSWKFLFDLLANKDFKVNKKTTCILHNVVAKDEALKYGMFRDSNVFIAGTDYLPPSANKLDAIWQNDMPFLIGENKDNNTTYQYSISVFLQMARYQFFFDGNKRTGRLIMNGILLSNGLPIINLPATKQLEFNQLMTKFYPTNIEDDMQKFMLSCLDERIITIMSEAG